MVFSNAMCVIVTMMATYFATRRLYIPSSDFVMKEIPTADPLATNVNLSIDVQMSVEDERSTVHNALFSVPTKVLYDAVLTILTPRQAAKLRDDIREATDSMIQKTQKDEGNEPVSNPRLARMNENDVFHLTPPDQSHASIEKEDPSKDSKPVRVSKESQLSSLPALHSNISDDKISRREKKKKINGHAVTLYKKHLEIPRHSVGAASSRSLSISEQPPRRRILSSLSPDTGVISEPTQSPSVVCQTLEIEIKTDDYGSETTWILRNDATGEEILSGGPYEDEVSSLNKYEICLFPGFYTFVILDSYGDGMIDEAYYTLRLNGVTLKTGGKFYEKDVVPIEVTLPSEALSSQPSISLKPSGEVTTLSPTTSPQPSSRPSSSLNPTTTFRPTEYCMGEGQVRGQITISAGTMSGTLTWGIFESQSDEVLFEGGSGSTDICITEYGCYTFRIHEAVDGDLFDYSLTLREAMQLEYNDVAKGHLAKFGLRSCCKTTCCPANQASMAMIINSIGSTEDLNWKLYQGRNESKSVNTIIMEGGQYSNDQDIYYAETCIDPMICHTLELLGENETSSYGSIVIKVDDEIKAREFDVPSGTVVEFCSICSTQPMLDVRQGAGNASAARIEAVLSILSHISNQEQLIDTKTAQYKAACWIIFDDLMQLPSNAPTLLQRYSLAVLYYATSGDDWRLSDIQMKYLSVDSECDWYTLDDYDYFYNGIECNEESQIITIDLQELNLKGHLPSEISSLRNLEIFILRSNSLEGTIPEEIGRFKALTQLDIKTNSFTGTIPDSIFDLSELRRLFLHENLLSGTLSTLVGNLFQLNLLVLDSNYFTGTIPEALYGIVSLQQCALNNNTFSGTISSSIGQLSNLILFSADNNELSGTIPTSIRYLQNLERFLVEYNRFTGSIPSEIGQVKKLITLRLNGNQLQGEIPEEMTLLPVLSELSLDDNLLEGTIPSNIGDPTYLERVYLNNNNFRGTIPSSFSSLTDLEQLRLYGNNLEGTMPEEICSLKDAKLTTLGTDCAYEYAPPKVECECCSYCEGRLSGLERQGECKESELRVIMSYEDMNWFGRHWSVMNGAKNTILSESYKYKMDTPPKNIYRACIAISDCITFSMDGDRDFDPATPNPSFFQTHLRLYPYLGFSIYVNEIKVYDNNDSENQMWHGSVKFGYSASLKTSALNQCDDAEYGNQTYVVGTRENLIMNQLATISGYSSISNELTAEFQAAQWVLYGDKHDYDLSNSFRIIQRYVLAVIYYSTNGESWVNNTNYITNENECDWAGVTCNDLSIVEGLYLRNNNIVGSIPYEIGQLSMLKHLDLSDNTRLNGELPIEMENLWSIQTLNISNCGIIGSIPPKIWLQEELRSLSMYRNELIGTLPDEIEQAKNLEILDIHNNSMSGSIPNLSRETKLKELDLSSNFFYGNLIDVELDFVSLGKLNLSNNILVGAVPSNLTRALGLTELDLSNNELTGYIPSGLNNMDGLVSIALNGNKFRGTIPIEVYEITGLKRLLLQSNELTGSISTRVGKLQNLDQLSLSYNSLKGTLPHQIGDLKETLSLFHVHFNEFIGDSDWMNNCQAWKSDRNFIADCGEPSASLSPLSCSCCTTCCNSDGYCRTNKYERFTPFQISLMFWGSVVGLFLVIAIMIKCLGRRCLIPVVHFDLVDTIGEDSIYVCLLTRNLKSWTFVLITVSCQYLVFMAFLIASSYKKDGLIVAPEFQAEINDWIYSKRCSPNSLECTDEVFITPFGWVITGLMLVYFLIPDAIKGLKILYASAAIGSRRLFVAGVTIVSVTFYAICASIFYNIAIAESDSQLIQNALLLAIFSSIDEEALKLLTTINPSYVKNLLREAEAFSEDIETEPQEERYHVEMPTVYPNELPLDLDDDKSETSEVQYFDGILQLFYGMAKEIM